MAFKQSGYAESALTGLRTFLSQDKVRNIAGRAGVNITRDHLFAIDSERGNGMGGRRSHFYSSAARSVHYKDTSDGVMIVISKTGIAQRFFGGTIRPVNAKKLAIPATPEAYGRRPGEFTNLEAVFGRRGAYALAERRATTLRKTRKGFAKGAEVGGKIMYWLVDKVEQDPDPTVLPTDQSLCSGIMDAIYSAEMRVLGE